MGQIIAFPESSIIMQLDSDSAGDGQLSKCGSCSGEWFGSTTLDSRHFVSRTVLVTAWFQGQIAATVLEDWLGFESNKSSRGPLDRIHESS